MWTGCGKAVRKKNGACLFVSKWLLWACREATGLRCSKLRKLQGQGQALQPSANVGKCKHLAPSPRPRCPPAQVLPPWLTTAILSPLLGFITANTLKKGILTYRGETRRLNMMRHSALDCTSEAAPGPGSDGGSGGGGYGGEGVGPRMQAVQTPQSYAYGMQSAGEPFPLALPSPSSHPLDIASEPLVRPYSSGSSGSSSTAGQLPPAAAAAAPPPKASLGEDTDRCWKPEVPAAKVGILVALLAGAQGWVTEGWGGALRK